MKAPLVIVLLSLSIAPSLAQKFVFSGSFGLTSANARHSVFNKSGDPNWEFTSSMFDDIASFPYALGVDVAFVYKRLSVSSGVHYVGTNHIAYFSKYNDVPAGTAKSSKNYFMGNLEIPILFNYTFWEPKYFSVQASLGASLNYNYVSSWSSGTSAVGIDSGSVDISSFMMFNQEPFFSWGAIVGMSIRPKTFLKKMTFGCYYNAQLQGGVDASIGTSSFTSVTNRRYIHDITYQIRPSYLVIYLKYDLFDFSLRE